MSTAKFFLNAASTQSTKYHTARGRSIYWTTDDEMEHEVKVFIRDTEELQDGRKCDELISKGVTHLIIEDNENNLKNIPQQLCGIHTLRSFTLMWSKVRVIPDYLLQLQLTEFCIHKCQLKNINGIQMLSSLVTLELVNDGLKKLPMEIGEITTLVNLDLTGNHLQTLPVSISNLQKLKVLKVSGNDLSEIPSAVGDIQLLDMLDISHNHISAIPDQIGNLSKLVTMRLSYNQIQELPPSFTKLENLHFLYMGHNQFTEIPSVLGKLPKIDTLNMVSNKVHTMEVPIEQLTTLLLDKNELEELPQPLFKCDKLEKLSVQFNKLNSVPAQIARLDRLRALYIGGNRFSKLPVDICMLNNLRHLVLRGSMIEDLPSEFDRLENLSMVDIEDTQLDGCFQFAVKTDGIKGLMEQVVLKRELTETEDKDSDSHHGSGRGSSVFDSEDESATTDSEAPDDTSSKPDGHAVPEIRQETIELCTTNAKHVRNKVASIYPCKTRPRTMYPPKDDGDNDVAVDSL